LFRGHRYHSGKTSAKFTPYLLPDQLPDRLPDQLNSPHSFHDLLTLNPVIVLRSLLIEEYCLPSRRILRALFALLALLAVAVTYSQASRSVDFMAYYYAARVAMGLQPGRVYGLASGIGWPQFFRYPPLFLVLILPLALLPYKLSVAVWAAFKCAALYLVIRTIGRRLNFPRTGLWWLVPVLLCGGFLAQELILGNVQFLVFAVVAAGLLALERHEWRGAFLLALGVTLKIWPLFFMPYVAVRKGARAALLMAVSLGGLMLLPAAYFGWSGNINLVRDWIVQEHSTSTLAGETWFPGQSLAGIMERYLTVMDYSKWPDRNYVQLHLLQLNPRVVELIWYSLAGAAYLGLLWLARKTSEHGGLESTEVEGPAESPIFGGVLLADALAFCALPLLSPFAHRIAFVVLLWPAMVAGALLARPGFPSARSKGLIGVAVAIEAIEPLLSSARMQRLFQVIGVDFWAACILTAGLLTAWMEWRHTKGVRQANESRSPESYELSAARKFELTARR
jgi:Glycosyltransferase family 87